ncbi:MAG: CoA transferase [Chloroflexi bacterium]|nr:CoA transferase [Chloroflexota bacterium]
MTERILEDLKVVDLTWVVAGPRVSRALADYGATVVHVESSRRIETARVAGPFQDGVFGPEHSLMYGNGNAGKLGVTLDLAREEALGVMRDLLRWGDVFIESFTPGVVGRWGLPYPDVQALNPAIIMVSTCLMGQYGPFAEYAGYGTAGAGMSGFQNLAGWPGRPPIGPFGPYTDYVGPRFALPLVLAALDHRRRTGEGCYIDHSQSESGQFFLAPEFADYFATGRSLEYNGNEDAMMAPHGAYPCRSDDGASATWVAIAIRNDDEWASFARLVGGDELAGEPRYALASQRLERAAELDEIVAEWTQSRTAEAIETMLQDAGIPVHRASNASDLAADPQLAHRGHFIELEHPIHGTTHVENSRFTLSRTPARVERVAPTLGRDQDLVLREILQYPEPDIEELLLSGALE